MNLVIWIVSGALVGWVAFEHMDLSHDRGRFASILIGAAGGVIGGMVLAPMLGIGTAPETVSVAAFFIATCAAAGLLVIGNYVYNLWRI
jgi:uncharacterized membrane protein YeaQ/YmgE (transglycosylase-associated protein family)